MLIATLIVGLAGGFCVGVTFAAYIASQSQSTLLPPRGGGRTLNRPALTRATTKEAA